MAGETIITIVGNLVNDPEAKQVGQSTVVNFRIASATRQFNRQSNQWEDGATLFMSCSAWNELGQHVLQSVSKGMRVIVQGRLQQRSWKDQQGNPHSMIELQVDEIGPSLKNATAQVQKTTKNNTQQGYASSQGQFSNNQPFGGIPPVQGGQQYAQQPPAQQPQDPWSTEL